MNTSGLYPSIFNDVIGPVMRGPSSSHVAASARIGKVALQLLAGELRQAIVELDEHGAIAPTYRGHGTEVGLVSGLLGWQPHHEFLAQSVAIAKDKGLSVDFRIVSLQADHPNTMKLTLIGVPEEVCVWAISTGGGMFEITNIQGFPVSVCGDFCETLFVIADDAGAVSALRDALERCLGEPAETTVSENPDTHRLMVQMKTTQRFDDQSAAEILRFPFVETMYRLDPVLPTLSSRDCQVPFSTARELEDFVSQPVGSSMAIWELAALYESQRGGRSVTTVLETMRGIVRIMKSSVISALKGTEYADRILGAQAYRVLEAEEMGRLIPMGVLNTVIAWTTAMMEAKSAMGVIVAAPTAGSCGVLPGTLLGSAHVMDLDEDAVVEAMMTAGLIGVFIAKGATFAAEVCGCQAECGAASAMAAAGLVTLMDGTTQQAMDAASVALQNVLGLICDPVADRVEVPCLGKNIMAASNAVAAANMILSGFDVVIPLDETIAAMYKVGEMLPPELRCTGLGGLSVADTAKTISNRMQGT